MPPAKSQPNPKPKIGRSVSTTRSRPRSFPSLLPEHSVPATHAIAPVPPRAMLLVPVRFGMSSYPAVNVLVVAMQLRVAHQQRRLHNVGGQSGQHGSAHAQLCTRPAPGSCALRTNYETNGPDWGSLKKWALEEIHAHHWACCARCRKRTCRLLIWGRPGDPSEGEGTPGEPAKPPPCCGERGARPEVRPEVQSSLPRSLVQSA